MTSSDQELDGQTPMQEVAEDIVRDREPDEDPVYSAESLFDGVNENPETPDPISVFHDPHDDKYHHGSRYFVEKHRLAIVVPPVTRRWEYKIHEEPQLEEILEEYEGKDELSYLVRFTEGTEDEISFNDLLELEGGPEAIESFNTRVEDYSDPDVPRSVKTRKRKSSGRSNRRRISEVVDYTDDELSTLQLPRPICRRRKLRSLSKPKSGRSSQRQSSRSYQSMISLSSEITSDESISNDKKRRRAQTGTRSTRAAAQKRINYSDAVPFTVSSEESNVSMSLGKRKRGSGRNTSQHLTVLRPRRRSPASARRSSRSARGDRNMREVDEDDIPDQNVTINGVKFTGAKEHFKNLPDNDEFRDRHCQTCDVCYEVGDNEERGRLVFCQGCTLAYHQRCLGHRASREHLVTKIGDRNFVLQCRRCISYAKKKDRTAPDQGKCFSCNQTGAASFPYRERKSTKQEQKEREENDGEDPIVEALPDMINNYKNVLFRCMTCYRACHLHHLEPKNDSATAASLHLDDERKADQRLREYAEEWRCKTCIDAPADVDGLVAWRPIDIEQYVPGTTTEMVEEDAKEYLVKWKKLPYTKIMWMPGAWVWGVTSPVMRKAFARRDNETNLPKMTTEEAVPEEFMRVDIVFDIEYTNVVKLNSEKVDKARIKEVKRALVKFKGLGYEDVIWIEPPHPEEKERYNDFKDAYEYWVMGLHISPPSTKNLHSHLAKVRAQSFPDKLALSAQPRSLSGGKLMDYQLEGINWLYYQWFRQQNAILADEMGLGKTIQIIGFLATLKEEHACWPFLIVVPNSTCPNWRREIKQWAPGLRVVTYYGSAESRKLALKHELFPNGPKDLRSHFVVTSYDAAQDQEFRLVFRGVRWAGLVVDEGQRLKNDKSILYGALNALRAPFKILLTGTPLQNNARELFNLLQFLDPSEDAQAMDEQYADLDAEKVKELHDKLKPIFLRRTKAQVLTFLPPMAQIIVPVSPSTLQKKLYRSILAKNPELIKSIIGASKKAAKQTDRANLNNILMQLRKCLCHPFVYSRQIEERSRDPTVSHRNLVDASSKLQLLELMLPRLLDRGHRVLIFSQFLDMLDIVEDFLDGLGLLHQRLDGSMNSLEKQRRIDEFNAPDSSLFAFLLSTRAGGVGINLATADTVIILDPDFNPHQDIQALSRAHRIGQQRKVLVFQLTTRSTAEEKIMQIGKKKMLLDHVLIEQMDADDDAGLDLESILRHGTEAIFSDDDTQDIKYDIASVDKLLDRSQIEDTQADKDKSAESQFSFAKVWVNDKGALEEGMEEGMEDIPEQAPDASLWDKILKQREREAAEEAALREKDFGRGRRKRQNVNYTKEVDDGLPIDSSPVVKKTMKKTSDSDSDTDFQAPEEESDDADVPEGDGEEALMEPGSQSPSRPSRSRLPQTSPNRGPDPNSSRPSRSRLPQISPNHGPDPNSSRPSRSRLTQTSPSSGPDRNFKRAELPNFIPRGAALTNGRAGSAESDDVQHFRCIACGESHDLGFCPLKIAGIEFCNLCGLPHYGFARTCPHLNSVTQLRAMVEAIKRSPESSEIKELARKRVVGIIGDLNFRKRRKQEAQQKKEGPLQPSRTAQHQSSSIYGQANGRWGTGYLVSEGGKANSMAGPLPRQPQQES
ncbi:MAG: hypothetical protein Q9217_000689 [Psora testacea]